MTAVKSFVRFVSHARQFSFSFFFCESEWKPTFSVSIFVAALHHAQHLFLLFFSPRMYGPKKYDVCISSLFFFFLPFFETMSIQSENNHLPLS